MKLRRFELDYELEYVLCFIKDINEEMEYNIFVTIVRLSLI